MSWHPFGQRLAAMNAVLYGPRSRGRVSLSSIEGKLIPNYDFNLLQDESDLRRFRDGFRFIHDIMSSAPVRRLFHAVFAASFSPRVQRVNQVTWQNWTRTAVLTAVLDCVGPSRSKILSALVGPGWNVDQLMQDDTLLDRWLQQHATGFFHPVGSCRMGAGNDANAVVDVEGASAG